MQRLFCPQQIQDQGLQRPDGEAEGECKTSTNSDYQTAKTLGAYFIALAQGSGDDGSGGNARPTYMPLTSCCMGTVKPSAASGSRPSWPTKALSVRWKVISESTPKSMGQVMW